MSWLPLVRTAWLAGLPLAILSPVAVAEPVFSNGPADPVSGSGREMSAWIQADDFLLTSDTVLTGASLQWFTLGAGLKPWDRTIDWYVFKDQDGTPGDLLASGGALNVLSEFDGAGTYSWYTTTFDFDTPVPVVASRRYWFGLHFASDFDRDDLYWADSTTGSMSSTHESLGGSMNNWIDVSGKDRAYSLIPAPGTVPAAALLAVAVLRRGRRNRPA